MIIDLPNLTEMLSTDGPLPDRADGWFLKITDTGEVYHRVAGVWQLWGLGLSFAPPTKSGQVQTDNDGEATVRRAPMLRYATCSYPGWSH